MRAISKKVKDGDNGEQHQNVGLNRVNKNMSTKKIILYILIPAFFIIIIGTLFILNRNKKAADNNTTNQESNSNESTNAEKITIKTTTGEISVNNFRKNAEVIENGNEYFVDKDKYNISYDPSYQGFIATLLVNQDIENTRKEAENDFINALGISQEDACKLKVFLYVSAALTDNEELYQNHGLSFCPGAKTFN
jgi:uncharacterized membrane protein